MAVAPNVSEPFPFMRLPPEIRVMIYKGHLVQPSPIESSRLYGSGYDAFLDRIIATKTVSTRKAFGRFRIPQAPIISFFGVSRHISNEAVPIYFGYNTFIFRDTPQVEKFIKALPARDRHALRSVEIQIDNIRPAAAAQALSLCPNIRRLKIEFGHHLKRTKSDSKESACGTMRICGLKQLLKLRGVQELTVTHMSETYRGLGDGAYGWSSKEWDVKEWDALVEKLQIVKQPRSKVSTTRRINKDFPELSKK